MKRQKRFVGVELWGGLRRLTSRSRRAAFAALTPLTLGAACGNAWSLCVMPRRVTSEIKAENE